MRNQKYDNLVQLQKAFSAEAWHEISEDCPDHEVLWASAAEELDPVADEAVLLHLARCAQCSSIWRLAREMSHEEDPTSAQVIPVGVFGRLAGRPLLALATAAAALVGISLGATVFFNKATPLVPVYREQHRIGKITASPATSELARTACRLQWKSDLGATSYDLIVSNENLEVLFSIKGLVEPEFILLRDQLPPVTQEIFWCVTAHLPDRATVSSETFTTRIIQHPLSQVGETPPM